jgi:hypothetical protein
LNPSGGELSTVGLFESTLVAGRKITNPSRNIGRDSIVIAVSLQEVRFLGSCPSWKLERAYIVIGNIGWSAHEVEDGLLNLRYDAVGVRFGELARAEDAERRDARVARLLVGFEATARVACSRNLEQQVVNRLVGNFEGDWKMHTLPAFILLHWPLPAFFWAQLILSVIHFPVVDPDCLGAPLAIKIKP